MVYCTISGELNLIDQLYVGESIFSIIDMYLCKTTRFKITLILIKVVLKITV